MPPPYGLKLSLSTLRALEVRRGSHRGNSSQPPSQEGHLVSGVALTERPHHAAPVWDIPRLRDDPDQPALKENLHPAEILPQTKGLLRGLGTVGGDRALHNRADLQELASTSNS